jgi:Uma2 family endonuclease
MATAFEARLQEQVVQLKVSWETYETLAAGIDEDSHTLLSYDGETLELRSPHTEHEAYKTLIDLLLGIVMAEWDINLYGTGSTTLKAKPIGAEPDTSYYSANAAKVGGFKQIDLGSRPPPDLVVEIDLSRGRMDKLRLYAELSIPEYWRLNHEGLQAFTLIDRAYAPIDVSRVVVGLPMGELERFLERRLEPDRRTVCKDWQAWLRTNQHLHHST